MTDQMNKLIDRTLLGRVGLHDLKNITEGLSMAERARYARTLESTAVFLIRVSAYVLERGGDGIGDSGHQEAVNSQNQRARDVRRILGYDGTIGIEF